MARFYKYSIIRAIPDERRGEVINVGVIVLKDVGVDVRLVPSFNKLKALDGTVELSLLYSLEKRLTQLTEGIASIDERHSLIRKIAFIELSDLGMFEAVNDIDYEDKIERLMRQLVIPRRKPRKVAKHTRISTELRASFDAMKILGQEVSDIERHMIVPNFPIDSGLELSADFALRNGTMHILQTIDFRVKSGLHTDKFREACETRLTLQKASSNFGKETRNYVIYAADETGEVERHISAMAEVADETFNFAEHSSRQFFLEKMRGLATGQLNMTENA